MEKVGVEGLWMGLSQPSLQDTGVQGMCSGPASTEMQGRGADK